MSMYRNGFVGFSTQYDPLNIFILIAINLRFDGNYVLKFAVKIDVNGIYFLIWFTLQLMMNAVPIRLLRIGIL